MRLAYIGNFEPEFSTENEILHALGVLGHDVDEIQEQNVAAWALLLGRIRDRYYDAVLWTSTASLANQVGQEMQYRMLDWAVRANVPTIAVHLDRWWGLDREDQLDWPYFSCQHVFTADGGHQEQFEAAGINHTWFPPAISERWCQPGTPRPEYECDVLFVGNWFDYGHREWKHRPELIDFLSRTYGDRFLALPRRGHPAIRGLALNDVYWSAKVVVGDSCLVLKADGSPMTHYCSDRVPETLGRGGWLVHPYVEGVCRRNESDPAIIEGLFAYRGWELGDWKGLRREVDRLIEMSDDGDDTAGRLQSIELIKAEHTYTRRMEWVLKEVSES